MTNGKDAENANFFECKICRFKCFKNSNWEKHLSTDKHTKLNNTNEYNSFNAKIQTQSYICLCGNNYRHQSSLWNHKKKCVASKELQMVKQEEPLVQLQSIDKEMVMEILKQNDDLRNLLVEQNKEFKGMMMEICKNGINNTNCNNTNKTFNLQFFLNEQCKDAMNMMDFVNSLQLTLQDAENVGKLGYVRGISNIIIENLKALDVFKRPFHCTDTKREVMYVKDDNKWEKETDDFTSIRKLIKNITFKNGKNIRLFKTKHPCCGTSDSIYSDQYSKMYIEGFGGSGTDRDNEYKIIKRLAREITIDKSYT